MSNLEHLIENGLCRLNEGTSYIEWREIMQRDCNWKGNENITLDNLWEICQYIIFTWDLEKERRYDYQQENIMDSLEDSIISLIVEYLCEDHTETELMAIVNKAIQYANGR